LRRLGGGEGNGGELEGVRPKARWKMVDWQRKAFLVVFIVEEVPRSSRFRESGEVFFDAALMMFLDGFGYGW